MQVLRMATCVGVRVGGDWKRSLLDLGADVVARLKFVAVRVLERVLLLVVGLVMMLEELEGVEVVAVGVRRRLEGGAEAVVVEGLASLEGVSEVAVVEPARRCDLTTLSSDTHAHRLSRSLCCLGASVTVPYDSCFESGLAVYLPLVGRSSHGLELDLLAVAPVAHAHILLHAPWLLRAASRVL